MNHCSSSSTIEFLISNLPVSGNRVNQKKKCLEWLHLSHINRYINIKKGFFDIIKYVLMYL